MIISLISTGKTIIEDILDSEDVYHTMKAVEQLGAKLKINNNHIEVKGVGLGNLYLQKTLFIWEIVEQEQDYF